MKEPKELTVEDAIGVLRDDNTVIYWREGTQPQFKAQLIALIRKLARPQATR